MMSNAAGPLISVIIPTFNSEKTIGACLQSIVRQTYVRYEIVVVDGLSNDRTPSIVKDWRATYPVITWSSEKDEGIYDAMNKGLLKAKGEWLIFLGSDDELFDENVLKNVFGDVHYNDLLMIYGKALVLPERSVTTLGYTFDTLAGANLCHQSAFYSVAVFKKRKYDLKFRVLADWDLNLYLFAHYSSRIRAVDIFVCKYLNLGVSADWKKQSEYVDNFSNKRELYFRYLPLVQILKRILAAAARRVGLKA